MTDAPSLSELERQMNPRVAVPDVERYIADMGARGRAALADLKGARNLRYGKGRLTTLDIFPAAEDAPAVVLIHGGYWRALDKDDYAFAVPPLIKAGLSVASLNYDLCPSVTLDEIVVQCRHAIAWLRREGANYGFAADRITVVGHSAGAHLAVMLMAQDWGGAEALPDDILKSVVAISGIYDLEPVRHITVNEQVRLSVDMARRNSPMLEPPPPVCPLLIAVGDGETPMWIQQSLDFHVACRDVAVEAQLLRVPAANHFDTALVLADPDNPLTRAIVAHARA
jgi:arylformamidase